MNKTTFSHYGSIIAVVIILAIMVAFATPFGDYVADSSNQLISSFTGKSNASLSEANSRDYKFRPLLVSRIVSATNQSGDPLTYDALDMNSASLRSGLVAFTSGSVDELNVNNAQLLDVTVEGEYTSATISFDVSDLAREGDEIGVYHYNESTNSWEHIGNYVTSAELQITATFASLSPVALINLTKDYTVVETPDDPQQQEETKRLTDLTGTTWILNNDIEGGNSELYELYKNPEDLCGSFHINYQSSGVYYDGETEPLQVVVNYIGMYIADEFYGEADGLHLIQKDDETSQAIHNIGGNQAITTIGDFTGPGYYIFNTFLNEVEPYFVAGNVHKISITGGEDATNPEYIDWLYLNARLIGNVEDEILLYVSGMPNLTGSSNYVKPSDVSELEGVSIGDFVRWLFVNKAGFDASGHVEQDGSTYHFIDSNNEERSIIILQKVENVELHYDNSIEYCSHDIGYRIIPHTYFPNLSDYDPNAIWDDCYVNRGTPLFVKFDGEEITGSWDAGKIDEKHYTFRFGWADSPCFVGEEWDIAKRRFAEDNNLPEDEGGGCVDLDKYCVVTTSNEPSEGSFEKGCRYIISMWNF